MVSPPSTNTQKSLLASVTNCWLITPEWIEKSWQNGYFVDEIQAGGVKYHQKPIQNKTFFISESFQTKVAAAKQTVAIKLLEFGQANVSQVLNDSVNYVLVATGADAKSIKRGNYKILSWETFMSSCVPGYKKKELPKNGKENQQPALTANTASAKIVPAPSSIISTNNSTRTSRSTGRQQA